MTAERPGAARRSAGLVRAVVGRLAPGWGLMDGLAGGAPQGGTAGRPARLSRAALRAHQERVTREWEVMRDRLAAVAGERIADVGDLLSDARLEFTPEHAERAVRRDYEWAMEAYQAAGKLLDEAADLPDLAAAIVLADRAVERFAAAHARHAGERPAPAVVRCFYNPLHGRAERDRSARSGGRRGPEHLSAREAAARRRPACGACRMAILAGQRPDVLPALTEVKAGRRRTATVFVPYYAVPQSESIWSATSCGAADEAAPARVLRGEHRGGRGR